MAGTSPLSGSLSDDNYRSLIEGKNSIKMSDGTILSFSDPNEFKNLSSINEVSLSFKKPGSSSAIELPLRMTSKTPLFKKIQDLKDVKKVKALLAEYATTLFKVYEKGSGERVSVIYNRAGKCSKVLRGTEDVSSDKVTVGGNTSLVTTYFTNLATAKKTENVFKRIISSSLKIADEYEKELEGIGNENPDAVLKKIEDIRGLLRGRKTPEMRAIIKKIDTRSNALAWDLKAKYERIKDKETANKNQAIELILQMKRAVTGLSIEFRDLKQPVDTTIREGEERLISPQIDLADIETFKTNVRLLEADINILENEKIETLKDWVVCKRGREGLEERLGQFKDSMQKLSAHYGLDENFRYFSPEMKLSFDTPLSREYSRVSIILDEIASDSQMLAIINETLESEDAGGGGACLFHSFRHLTEGSVESLGRERAAEGTAKVRADIVAEMRGNPGRYMKLAENLVKDQSSLRFKKGDEGAFIKKYCVEMAKGTTWGGQAEAQAFANIMKRPIIMLSQGSGEALSGGTFFPDELCS